VSTSQTNAWDRGHPQMPGRDPICQPRLGSMALSGSGMVADGLRMGGCGAKAKGVVRTWCRTPNPNPAHFLHQRHGALRCHIHP
jgi:hypothetical protein